MERVVEKKNSGGIVLSQETYQRCSRIINAIAKSMQTPGHPFLCEEDLVAEGWVVLLHVWPREAQLSRAMKNRVYDLRRQHLLAKKRVVQDQNGDPWVLSGMSSQAHLRATQPEEQVALRQTLQQVFLGLREGGEQEVFKLACRHETGDVEWLAAQTGLSRPWVQGLKRSIRKKLREEMRDGH